MKKDHKDKLKKLEAKESEGDHGSDDEKVSPTKIIKEKVQKKRLRSSRRWQVLYKLIYIIVGKF